MESMFEPTHQVADPQKTYSQKVYNFYEAKHSRKRASGLNIIGQSVNSISVLYMVA